MNRLKENSEKTQNQTVEQDGLVIPKQLAIAIGNSFELTANSLSVSPVITAADANAAIGIYKALFDLVVEKYGPKESKTQ